MKKVVLGILGMAVVLSICAMTAFAAAPGRGPNFVDADGDGICDNCGVPHRRGMGAGCGRNFVDADGDGVCDNCGIVHQRGMGAGAGKYFVDADGDGICDNYGTRQGQGQGAGCGRGCRSGRSSL